MSLKTHAYIPTPEGGLVANPQLAWIVVFPIYVRRRLPDSKLSMWEDSLVYIASSEEKAIEFCQRNTDIELRNIEGRWWWFCINQEAIDGEYSGIKGLVCLLDWDAKPIKYDPVHGYKKVEEHNEEEVKV